VAPITRFDRDERASEASHDMLDSYLHGQRSPGKRRPFDATSLFNLPNYDPRPRGKKITPVKEIMSQILGIKKQPIDLTTDSQIILMWHTRDLLKKIPYKILSFAEDVRPPYKGTYSGQPMSGMRRLARNPLRRDLPKVDYDNDSEAEWEDEGDEGGEDIESEGEEEENMSEGEEDIEGFLDDADVVANVRNDMKGDLEPQCSGLCWEDENRRGPNLKMYRYLMEFMSRKSPYSLFTS
jgi:chromatin assembly factor 1 subunit A